MHIYLDNNATTRPAPEVVEAMLAALREDWGNPSSVHRFGQRARQKVELAREQLCQLIDCGQKELIFTSGATESCNTALRGILASRAPRRTVITTALEHSAVREPCDRLEQEGFHIIRVPVCIDGVVEVNALSDLMNLAHDDVGLVAIHWINNETGVIQPIEQIGAICREHRVPLFTDATQAMGKVKVNLRELPVEAAAFSGHKFHGPKGIGGLYVRSRQRFLPQQLGGPHERDRRGGTENVPGIIGMGVAAELAAASVSGQEPRRGGRQRDRLEGGICAAVPEAVVNSVGAQRIWNTTNIGFPPLEAEAVLILLSEKGISASAGAACSSGSLEPSPVLLAQGIPEAVAHGSIRLSLSRYTTDEEIDQAIQIIPQAIQRLRASMPAAQEHPS